jgi:hypothetical protein
MTNFARKKPEWFEGTDSYSKSIRKTTRNRGRAKSIEVGSETGGL